MPEKETCPVCGGKHRHFTMSGEWKTNEELGVNCPNAEEKAIERGEEIKELAKLLRRGQGLIGEHLVEGRKQKERIEELERIIIEGKEIVNIQFAKRVERLEAALRETIQELEFHEDDNSRPIIARAKNALEGNN